MGPLLGLFVFTTVCILLGGFIVFTKATSIVLLTIVAIFLICGGLLISPFVFSVGFPLVVLLGISIFGAIVGLNYIPLLLALIVSGYVMTIF